MAATRSMFPEKKSLMGAAPRSALTSTLAAVVDSSAAMSAPDRLHRTRGDMWSYVDTYNMTPASHHQDPPPSVVGQVGVAVLTAVALRARELSRQPLRQPRYLRI